MRRVAVFALGLVVVAGVASCGGGDDQRLDPASAAMLQAQVRDARVAVSRGQYEHALQLLDRVTQTIGDVRRRSGVSAQRAATMLDAVDEARSSINGYAATTTTSTTRPPPTTQRNDRDHDEGNDKGKKKEEGDG
jgi:hypothetical protein